MARRHAGEFEKTSFANAGRIAGAGIVYDRYDDEYIEFKCHHQPKFDHAPMREHGEVVVRKASDVLGKNKEVR